MTSAPATGGRRTRAMIAAALIPAFAGLAACGGAGGMAAPRDAGIADVADARRVESQYSAALDRVATYLESGCAEDAQVRQFRSLDAAAATALARLRTALSTGDGRAVEGALQIARFAVSRLASQVAGRCMSAPETMWL